MVGANQVIPIICIKHRTGKSEQETEGNWKMLSYLKSSWGGTSSTEWWEEQGFYLFYVFYLSPSLPKLSSERLFGRKWFMLALNTDGLLSSFSRSRKPWSAFFISFLLCLGQNYEKNYQKLEKKCKPSHSYRKTWKVPPSPFLKTGWK